MDMVAENHSLTGGMPCQTRVMMLLKAVCGMNLRLPDMMASWRMDMLPHHGHGFVSNSSVSTSSMCWQFLEVCTASPWKRLRQQQYAGIELLRQRRKMAPRTLKDTRKTCNSNNEKTHGGWERGDRWKVLIITLTSHFPTSAT